MHNTSGVTTLNHLFFHHLERFRHPRLLTWARPEGMVVYSSEDFERAVFALLGFLRSRGLAEGDRVAIFSENRPEWHVADFAILLARMVVVPVYPTLAPVQIEYLLRHSGCHAVVISGKKQWDVLAPLLPGLPQIRWVIGMDETPGADASLGRITTETAVTAEERERICAEALAVDPQTLATIVYTSGTTGTPKGVMLSHANLAFDLRQALERLDSQGVSLALSVLPLPHIFERLLCYGYFHEGIPIAYGDPHDLKALLPLHRPELMGAVPRMLEKIREAVDEQMGALAAWRQEAGRALMRAGLARTRARLLAVPAPLSARLLALLAGPLVYARIHRRLGGRLRGFLCGGAWLDPQLELWFRAAGFDLLQGYGMTETSPVITLNLYRSAKLGTVGPPLDGVEVRLSEDGEVLTRGPHVMLGYYNDPEATRQSFRDGWLLTGDLGRLDEQGCLTITGRRKEILVLSNGKNVACAAVEQALERSDFIQQALVVGERRKFACALIVPHRQHLAHFADSHGLRFANEEELLLSPPVVELFRREVAAHQAHLSSFEQVKRFGFLPEKAFEDPELVTPTLKVRRAVLERRYGPWIQQMYEQEEPPVIPAGQPRDQVPAGRA